MPHTKVRIEIPLMHYKMDVENYEYSDRGLIPDFTVIPNIEDEINNNKQELNFAIKRIEGN